MKVGSRRPSGHAALPDLLSGRDGVAFFYRDAAQMKIMGDDAPSRVHIDALAGVIMISREKNSSGEGRSHGSANGSAVINPSMRVSGLAVENPPPPVGACDDPVHRAAEGKPPFPGESLGGKGF